MIIENKNEEFELKEKGAKYYFETEALSQSKLKLLLLDPKKFNEVKEQELYFEEKKHFLIGSAVDFLFTYNDMDLFNDTYYVSTLKAKPTDVVKSIINMVNDECYYKGLSCFEELKTMILGAYIYHNHYSNLKDENKLAKFFEKENIEYFIDLCKSNGKIILSEQENNTVMYIVNSVTQNPFINKYFDEDIYGIVNQAPIYFNYQGIDCKALLDRICINFSNKTIQIIDFKTTGENTIKFKKQFRDFRYDLQAAFYTQAIQSYLIANNFEDYEVLPFMFIVKSIKEDEPLMFVFESCFDTTRLDALIEDYMYYLENGFEVLRSIKENEYCFTITNDDIKYL